MDEVTRSMIRHLAAGSVMELRIINSDPSADTRLSFKDVMFLNLIATMEDCTPSKLADAACVTKPTITSRLNGLEDKGFIRRARSDEDGRVQVVELTPRIADVYRMEWGIFERMVEDLRERFGEERLRDFAEVLDEASRLLPDCLPEKP